MSKINNLNNKQVILWQTLYNFSKEKKALFGFKYKNKDHKEFLKPFINANLICKEHFKNIDALVLNKKGVEMFEDLLNKL